MLTLEQANFALEYCTDELFEKLVDLVYLAVVKKSLSEGNQENEALYVIDFGIKKSGDRETIHKIVDKCIKQSLDHFVILKNLSRDSIEQIDIDSSIKFTETSEFGAQLNNEKIRPVRCGFGGINYRMNSVGTLGCAFTCHGSGKATYVISNWHILCNIEGKLKDSILQPGKGREDKGDRRTDVFAELVWYKLDENIDAAICVVLNNDDIKPGINCIGDHMPRGVAIAIPGMRIMKSGRTTNVTKGTIYSINASVKFRLGYPKSRSIFKKQILSKIKTEDGDSGSIILNNEGDAIALHIGGNGNGFSVSNHLSEIFRVAKKGYNDPMNNNRRVNGIFFDKFLTK